MRWNSAVTLGLGLVAGFGLGFAVRSKKSIGVVEALAAARRVYLPRYDVSTRPDAELAALFKANTQDLSTLVTMVKSDMKRLVDDGFSNIAQISVEFLPWPEGVASCQGINDARANQYRDLLRKIGIRCALRAGLDSTKNNTIYIRLIDARIAWPDVVSESGLWYSEVPPADAMFDVDSGRISSRRAYLPLDGGWYIFVSGSA